MIEEEDSNLTPIMVENGIAYVYIKINSVTCMISPAPAWTHLDPASLVTSCAPCRACMYVRTPCGSPRRDEAQLQRCRAVTLSLPNRQSLPYACARACALHACIRACARGCARHRYVFYCAMCCWTRRQTFRGRHSAADIPRHTSLRVSLCMSLATPSDTRL